MDASQPKLQAACAQPLQPLSGRLHYVVAVAVHLVAKAVWFPLAACGRLLSRSSFRRGFSQPYRVPDSRPVVLGTILFVQI